MDTLEQRMLLSASVTTLANQLAQQAQVQAFGTSNTTAVPSSPLNLAATTASQSEINLHWDLADANDTSVLIQRKTGVAGTYQTLITMSGGEDIYTDVSCWANTTYYYRVIAANSTGNSSPSNEVSATTSTVPTPALNVVTNFAAVQDSPTTATISFTDTNATVSKSYFLERSNNGILYSVVASLETATSFVDTGLTPGATYLYRVRATSWTVNQSDYWPPVSLTMTARVAGPPVEPSQLSATDLSATSVLLAWTNNDVPTTQFEVDRAPYNPYGSMTYSKIALTPAGATSYTDNSATAETPYAYRVAPITARAIPTLRRQPGTWTMS